MCFYCITAHPEGPLQAASFRFLRLETGSVRPRGETAEVTHGAHRASTRCQAALACLCDCFPSQSKFNHVLMKS